MKFYFNQRTNNLELEISLGRVQNSVLKWSTQSDLYSLNDVTCENQNIYFVTTIGNKAQWEVADSPLSLRALCKLGDKWIFYFFKHDRNSVGALSIEDVLPAFYFSGKLKDYKPFVDQLNGAKTKRQQSIATHQQT